MLLQQLYDLSAPPVAALRPAAKAADEIDRASGAVFFIGGGALLRSRARLREPLRTAADAQADAFPDGVMPVPPPGQKRGGRVGVFMQCRLTQLLRLVLQKRGKPDRGGPVRAEAAHAVLPHHAGRKRKRDLLRGDPEQAVEPPVFAADRLQQCLFLHFARFLSNLHAQYSI